MTSAVTESNCRPDPAAAPVYLRPRVLLLAGGILLAWCYRDAVRSLPAVWASDPNCSHGYLVPPAALFFAWQAWRDHGWPIRPELEWGQFLAGLSRIGIAWIVHCACMLVPQLVFFDVLSLLFGVSGLLILLGGRAGYRPYGFALWFLAFMAPLPGVLYHWLVVQLQQGASVVAAAALETFLVPVVREGNYLHLPGMVLEVGAGCSGLRGLMGTFALALAVGQLVRGGWWFRLTLAALAVPIALAANCLRIILTGVIAYEAGASWSQGVWHDLEGSVTALLGTALVFLAAWLLTRVRAHARPGKRVASGS